MMTLGELNKNVSEVGKRLKKISSGQNINSAGDDASGFSISERMRVRIRALEQDERNVQNGASMLRVAEGAIQSQLDIMRTIKAKVIDADNDSNTDLDRATIQKEINQGFRQINDIAYETTYNGRILLIGGTKVDEVYSWRVLDHTEEIEGADSLNWIADVYDTLDNIHGPFDVLPSYSDQVATAEPLLGSASSVNLAGGVDGYYDPPTTEGPATFTMDFSGYADASELDGVGFTCGGRNYVFSTNAGTNYRTGTVISISDSDSWSAVATKMASAVGYIASGTAAGNVLTFTTSGTGTSADTTTPPVTGWSNGASSTTVMVGVHPAYNARTSASATGLGSFSASGKNAFPGTYHPAVTEWEEYVDPNTDERTGRWVEVSPAYYDNDSRPATAATVTKDISGVTDGSGITISGPNGTAYVKFVSGTSPLQQDSTGVYTVGINAAVSGTELKQWVSTGNPLGGSGSGVMFSLQGGQMTLTARNAGGYTISVSDGITGQSAVDAYEGDPRTTEYAAVQAFSGAVSNATGGTDRGLYHSPIYATYTMDLTSYDTISTASLDSFIDEVLGKSLHTPRGTYEFIDTTVPSSMDALGASSSAMTVDLKDLRTAVNRGESIADAFISMMAGRPGISDGSDDEAGTKALTFTAYSAGTAGNSETLSIREGKLSSYTVDVGQAVANDPSFSFPDSLVGKGFRAYCATCSEQWFNFQFTMGGEMDLLRPTSGSSGADLVTTLIDIHEVTGVSSLIQAIYEQGGEAMEHIRNGHAHTLHIAADPEDGTFTVYDHRKFALTSDRFPNLQEKGAKLADGLVDDVVLMKRGVFVNDLVIHDTDKASQNIHIRIPQTSMDHLFSFSPGTMKLSEFNVMTAQNREKLLGNQAGRNSRDGSRFVKAEERGLLDSAIDYLTAANTLIGSEINRLDNSRGNIVTSQESTQFSESTIRDADMAKEMVNYTKANVLSQSAQSMLAQANQNASGVLSLLQ